MATNCDIETHRNSVISDGKVVEYDDANRRRFDRLSDAMNEFAEETGVFGLNLLRSRLSRVETVFWILCTLFFACCTVRDLTNVTLAFLAQDTLSLTSQVTGKEVVLDPAPTIAFVHQLGTFDFRTLPVDVELDRMLDDFVVLFKNASVDHFVKQLDPVFFALLSTMLRDIISPESVTVVPSDELSVPSLEWASAYKERKNFELIQLSIEKVYGRLRAGNVDFLKLLKFVALHFCVDQAAFSLEVHHYMTGKEAGSPCAPKNLLFFDEEYLTFRLNKSLTFTYPLIDYASVSWNVVGGDGFSQKLYVDFAGTPQLAWERENNYLLASFNKAGERLVASIRISAIFYSAEDKTTRPCSKTFSKYDCKMRCSINLFVDLCGCYPLYFASAYERDATATPEMCPYNNRTSRDDHVINYLIDCSSKLNTSEVQAADSRCYDACLPDCRSQTIMTTTEHEALAANSTRNELRLQMLSFTYTLIEEKLSMTLDNFISQFGGILGLYIGISFASLVHIPLFAIRKTVEYTRRKTERLNEAAAFEMKPASSRRYFDAELSLQRVLRRLDEIDEHLVAHDRRFRRIEDVVQPFPS